MGLGSLQVRQNATNVRAVDVLTFNVPAIKTLLNSR